MHPFKVEIHPCADITSQPAPSHDGEARLYLSCKRFENSFESDPAILSSQFNQPVIYVNGIRTTGLNHKLTCLAMSWLFDRPVLGVYNLTGLWRAFLADTECERCDRSYTGMDAFKHHSDKHGANPLQFAQDLKQCATDYTMAAAPRQWWLLAQAAKRNGFYDPEVLFALFWARLSGNLAVRSLVGVLLRASLVLRWPKIYLLPHSQGCLITSIATAAFLTLMDALKLTAPEISVRALASPSPNWLTHKKLEVVKLKFSEDPVAMLSVVEPTPVVRKDFEKKDTSRYVSKIGPPKLHSPLDHPEEWLQDKRMQDLVKKALEKIPAPGPSRNDSTQISLASHDVRNYLMRFGSELAGWLPGTPSF